VIFPITDRRGAIIAFGGRILGDGQPKYLNSRDTPLFDKGRSLYALDKARAALAKGGEAIVAEGYMDVIALHTAGFAGAVAPLGTALTEAQLEMVWRLAPEPVVCLDGDAAGQRAALRAAERALPLLKPGRSLRFAVLPPGEDPDSLLRSGGRAALADALAAAKPLVDVLWESSIAGRALDTPERRAALEADLNRLAAQVADGAVQAQYRRELRDRLWRLFRPAPVAGTRAAASSRFAPRRGAPPPARHAPAPTGRLLAGLRETARPTLLLALAIDHPELLENGAEVIASIDYSDPASERVKRALLDLHAAGERLDEAEVKLHLKASGLEGIVARLLGSSVYKDLQLSAPGAAERARTVWAKTLLEIRKESAEHDLASAGDVMTEEWQLRIAELNREIARAHAEQIDDEPPFATPVAPRGTRGAD
jgi:DNA primase